MPRDVPKSIKIGEAQVSTLTRPHASGGSRARTTKQNYRSGISRRVSRCTRFGTGNALSKCGRVAFALQYCGVQRDGGGRHETRPGGYDHAEATHTSAEI